MSRNKTINKTLLKKSLKFYLENPTELEIYNAGSLLLLIKLNKFNLEKKKNQERIKNLFKSLLKEKKYNIINMLEENGISLHVIFNRDLDEQIKYKENEQGIQVAMHYANFPNILSIQQDIKNGDQEAKKVYSNTGLKYVGLYAEYGDFQIR